MDDLERIKEILRNKSASKRTKKMHYGKSPNLKDWMEMMGCFGDMFFGGKGKLN